MDTIQFQFKNDGDYNLNENILLNQAHYFDDEAYILHVDPRYGVWKLGIRFFNISVDEKTTPPDRSDTLQEITIAQNANQPALKFSTMGFQNHDLQLDLKYEQELAPSFSIFIKFIRDKKSLFLSFRIGEQIFYEWLLPLKSAFDTIHFYGSAESRHCAFDAVLRRVPKWALNSSLQPFRLDKIVVRHGDMFDQIALNKADLIILPASTDGSVTSYVFSRAKELGMPEPEKAEPGMVHIYPLNRLMPPFLAGYAYSVVEHSSTIDVINIICKELITLCKKHQIWNISLPLLGAGAGKIAPEAVLYTYDKVFNKVNVDLKVTVSVERQDTFLNLKAAYSDVYLPLPYESPLIKPSDIIELETFLNMELDPATYEVDQSGMVTGLNFQGVKLPRGLDDLHFLKGLKRLNLTESFLEDYHFLRYFKELEILYLSRNKCQSIEFLEHLTKLETLDLSYNNIEDLSPLSSHHRLRDLNLRGNRIYELSPLKRLRKLRSVNLSDNHLFHIETLVGFSYLNHLDVSDNEIANLDYLKNLTRLETLNISDNDLEDVRFLLKFKRLRYLKADNNPFVELFGLKLSGSGDHLPPILSYYERQAEAEKRDVTLPVKVLLLGNHGSGKSSLLYHVLHDQFSPGQDSTHIIRIQKYQLDDMLMPTAIFFDFGGQDYYHGLYRAFLSAGAVYLILWNSKTNVNSRRLDSNNVFTQDFTVAYWIAQKDYLEQEKFNGSQDPILLIQTYAEEGNRASIADFPHNGLIKNEHFVALRDGEYGRQKLNSSALDYLKSSIFDLVDKKRITKREPGWYVDFLSYILDQSSVQDHQSLSVKGDILPHYKRPGSGNYYRLGVELEQLHLQGLILYYPDDIPDRVWLNPMALVTYIHDNFLNRERLLINGNGEVNIEPADENERAIVQLLIRQKVLYFHEQTGNYIVPNFLPLASAGKDFSLMTFGIGAPMFVLKFTKFLPFGLINQMICYFGELPQIKKFWRDQLIFTIDNKVKVMINLNFQALEIKVFAAFDAQCPKSDVDMLTQYLFYAIMGLYWDLKMLSYREYLEWKAGGLKQDNYQPDDLMWEKIQHAENLYTNSACRPMDLFISLDDKYFISYISLCDEQFTVKIPAHRLDEQRNITELTKDIQVHAFQPFTLRPLIQPLKAIISYAKKDIRQVEQFKLHLLPLVQDGLMLAPWQDIELMAGEEWNETIQNKFNEADIVFFMVSPHLMAIDYVIKYEIKSTLKRYHNKEKVKIVPVILSAYHWRRKDNTVDLGSFLALPFAAQAVNSYPNEDEAWDYVAEAVRIMIEQTLFGTEEDMMSNNAMNEFRSKVMLTREGKYVK